MLPLRWLFLSSVFCLSACGDTDSEDAAIDLGSDTSCSADTQCDDGVYCNGRELCASGSCIAGSDPCVGSFCSETMQTCSAECPDADNDGQRDASCGGQDCDDSDPNRFPGNTEVCDVADIDEDCDPSTFGFRDADGDNNADAACCNVDDTGSRNCGSDCNDNVPNINPDAPEVCDEVDNDCDGSVDEGVIVDLYEDSDGDLFGAEGGIAIQGCLGDDPNLGNDTDAAINPGASETCGDNVDNDCNPRTSYIGNQIVCYVDKDNDGFTPKDSARNVCATDQGECPLGFLAQPSAREQEDCCDEDARVFPPANRLGEFYSQPSDCRSYDYNCDGRDEIARVVSSCNMLPADVCAISVLATANCGTVVTGARCRLSGSSCTNPFFGSPTVSFPAECR